MPAYSSQGPFYGMTFAAPGATIDTAVQQSQPQQQQRMQQTPEQPFPQPGQKFLAQQLADQQQQRPQINHTLYKTELCRSFEETGACRYGTGASGCMIWS